MARVSGSDFVALHLRAMLEEETREISGGGR